MRWALSVGNAAMGPRSIEGSPARCNAERGACDDHDATTARAGAGQVRDARTTRDFHAGIARRVLRDFLCSFPCSPRRAEGRKEAHSP